VLAGTPDAALNVFVASVQLLQVRPAIVDPSAVVPVHANTAKPPPLTGVLFCVILIGASSDPSARSAKLFATTTPSTRAYGMEECQPVFRRSRLIG
jgi:hypothetical protein